MWEKEGHVFGGLLSKVLKRSISQALAVLGYQITKLPKLPSCPLPTLDFEQFMAGLLIYANRKDFFFVQIGANDGIMSDPLYSNVSTYSLHGLVIEPQKAGFQQLQQNYAANNNLIFSNVAIARSPGTKTLYKVVPEVVERYADFSGCASFDLPFLIRVIRSHSKRLSLTSPFEKYVEVEEVETLPLMDLLQQHNITKVDLLQIDVEGHEGEVLKTINFDKIHPNVINFEHQHLSTHARDEANTFLDEHGYSFFCHGGNTCAYLMTTIP